MSFPTLRALVTGTPHHQVPQAEIQAAAARLFPRLGRRQKLLEVFGNARIETRWLARELEWYLEPHSFAEKNAVYVEEALALSQRLITRVLEEAGVSPAAVDALVFVSSSGISTPSLDALLIERLGLSRQAARLPLWGLGCAGGAQGLARAADLVRAGYQNVLLLAVEFCSLTLVPQDESGSNVVGTALFADGGAAALLTPGGSGGSGLARVHGSLSTLLPQSAEVMGWDVSDDGLKVRFSQSIPELVRSMMADNVEQLLTENGWTRGELGHYVVHPGGVKVLDTYQAALELPEGTLDPSRKVLAGYGNMSSPTVLFVLDEVLRGNPGGRGVLSAMGPGFCAEHVLLEF